MNLCKSVTTTLKRIGRKELIYKLWETVSSLDAINLKTERETVEETTGQFPLSL